MYNILFISIGWHQGFNHRAAHLESIKDAFPESDFIYETCDETLRKKDLGVIDKLETESRVVEKFLKLDYKKYDFIVGTGDLFFTGYQDLAKRLKAITKTPLIEFGERDSGAADFVIKRTGSSGIGHIISTKHLYIENNTNRVGVFLDHLNRKRNDQTNNILKYLKKVKNQYDIDVYHQGPDGITLNKFDEVPMHRGYKVYTLEKLSEYYRKCSVFFPSHRETITGGQPAMELGACGAVTVLHPSMYPKDPLDKSNFIFYDNLEDLNWNKILKYTTLEEREKTRNKVLSNCSPEVFRKKLINFLNNWKK